MLGISEAAREALSLFSLFLSSTLRMQSVADTEIENIRVKQYQNIVNIIDLWKL